MSVVDDSYGHTLKQEERASDPFAGGILNHGFQCGMLWGSSLAAGAQAYDLYGAGPGAEAQAIAASERIVDSFEACNKHLNCIDITNLDMKGNSGILKFLLKGGPIGCFRMAARYAPIGFDEIDDALSNGQQRALAAPVSCAAEVARKMGASDKHATMAAGFAGGIGLSGGACGALGAAIWITAMNTLAGGADSINYLDWPEGIELIDRFVQSSDYEFECSEITGRQFESIDDHADYVRCGGCAKIIEALSC